MNGQATVERGLVAVFSYSASEVARSVCPAWHLDVDDLLLTDSDVVGQSITMPDGTVRTFPRVPVDTPMLVTGRVFGTHEPDGTPIANAHKGAIDNLGLLRAALANGRGTGDGTIDVEFLYDGVSFASGEMQVDKVRGDELRLSTCSVAINVTIPGHAFS